MTQATGKKICMFDPFGEERCVYTFEPRCVENPELSLKDGTTRIFLNTKAKNRHELPAPLVELLDYLENPNTVLLQEQRMIELDNRLKKVKRNKEARDSYMTLQNLIEEERDEARSKAREELVQNMLLENIKVSLIVKVSNMLEEEVKDIKDKMIKEGKLKETK